MRVYIYALCEPDTGEIRYVGQSNNPAARLTYHLSNSAAANVRAWVSGLGGRRPMSVVLGEVSAEDADAEEARFIAQLRRPRLLNTILAGPKRRIAVADDVPARGLLHEFMQENNITYRCASKALGGLTHVAVLQWIRGPQRPLEASRQDIETWTAGRVPASSWLRDGEGRMFAVRPFEQAKASA